MKEGYILKSLDPSDKRKEDMDLINKYAIKKLNSEDVMIFKVVLCDNEIDRDFEAFDVECLNELAKLFVGKSGISDHSMKSKNQLARIFNTKVEKSENRKNAVGQDYIRLVAKAYVVKSKKNEDLINDIESGIKKEVSINCSVKNRFCSICGKNYLNCNHTAGQYYDDKLCYIKLANAKDAYEWSFVAVPAQVSAGVIKSIEKKQSANSQSRETNIIMKKLEKGLCVNLSAEESISISKEIKKLKELSKKGLVYEEEIRKKFRQLAYQTFKDLQADVLQSISEKLSIEELQMLIRAMKNKNSAKKDIVPQTMTIKGHKDIENIQFKV